MHRCQSLKNKRKNNFKKEKRMYTAGWSKQEIMIKPRGYAIFGYGQWHHRADGQQTPLFVRSLFIADEKDHAMNFCCLDMGCITGAMRTGVCEQLRERMGNVFNESSFVLTATHTHSAPGGCSHEALYNMPTLGFRARTSGGCG